jgi:Kef-type K+ transport system membrane component KefB
VSPELSYVALLFALFVVPKALQRLRIPGAITSLLLGIAASRAGLFEGDPTLALLSTLGIAGLFLFAGLDVEVRELRRGAGLVVQHVALQAALVAGAAFAVARLLDLGWRPAALVALALLTPSTGFILDSLASFGLDARQAFWTRSKAIATELVALAVLFVVLQSSSPARLAGATLALAVLVAVIPVVMRLFASAIAPWAPRSEFAFLVMLAVLAAFATRELGVYYLVGAFLVGIAARQFRTRLPALSSDRLVHAVEVFASFFAPFYFFHAGAHLRPEVLGPAALLAGAAFLVVFVPLRVGLVALHRRVALREPWREGRRVATSLLPTLVFSLVLAEILAQRFEVPGWLVGGLVVYTLVNTLVPAVTLGVAPTFDAPHAGGPDAAAQAGPSGGSAPEGEAAPAPAAPRVQGG